MTTNRAAIKRLAMVAMMAAGAFLSGCRQDMHNQPKYIPLRAADPSVWADGRSARMPVEHTIARGQLREDEYFYSGKIDGKDGDRFPLPVTLALLERGQNRYNIYCTPCHSRVGDGNGMVPQRGLKHPPSYHEDRLKKMPIGHFYDVMTNGYGAMLNYAAQIKPEDRWAIAAYIRVLQLSQDAKLSDVPDDQKNNIQDFPALEDQLNNSITTSPEKRTMNPPGQSTGDAARATGTEGAKKE